MQVANCRLIVGEKGSDVPLTEITPAEAIILGVGHMKNAGKYPITNLEIAGEATTEVVKEDGTMGFRPRTVLEEKRRLNEKYGKKKVAELFPGARPQFPQDFTEVEETVTEAEVGEREDKDDDEGAALFGTKEEAVAAAKRARGARQEVGVGDNTPAPSDD